MNSPITTLYLLPHSHTDLGYTHDPVIARELHDHFLDRAIEVCEGTASAPEHERFHWTIEVFDSLDHWWTRRGTRDRDRLLALMRTGQIDLGLRYTNGTFLNAPISIEWEVEQATSFCRAHGLPCTSIFQNDVNGLSIRYARELASRGAKGLVMGLNTTMGVSPFPRPSAFRWKLSAEHQLLVWHGWIYNRIGRFVHLNDIEHKLETAWPDLIANLPKDYPFSFAMMSATIGDNVGPFARLPQQVAAFNAKKTGLEIRLTTITRFLHELEKEKNIPEYSGDWTDVWNFGHGSMPQEVAMVRRAQRRLEVIRGVEKLTENRDASLPALLDETQREISLACEHTYEGQMSSDDQTLNDEGKRQWVECQINFVRAESLSMLALRKALIRLAAGRAVTEPSVLFINPTGYPLPVRILWNKGYAAKIAATEALEFLTELDREPAAGWLTGNPDLGIPEITLPPHSVRIVPLKAMTEIKSTEVTETDASPAIVSTSLSLQLNGEGAPTSITQPSSPFNWVNAESSWPFGLPVLERPDPQTPLAYKSEAEKRDPSDAEWNPNLKFNREKIGRKLRVTKKAGEYIEELNVAFAESPVRNVTYRLDALTPELLEVEVEIRLDDSSSMRALYLPFAFQLPGDSDIQFRYDSCGDWILAPEGQLPGVGTSLYESYRGVSLERNNACIYVIAPDAPLWQFGGFTFGHPHAKLNRRQATVHSWLYNNYWYTNFPSVAPGWFRLKYLLAFTDRAFRPEYADELYAHFQRPYLTHPLWPVDENRSRVRL